MTNEHNYTISGNIGSWLAKVMPANSDTYYSMRFSDLLTAEDTCESVLPNCSNSRHMSKWEAHSRQQKQVAAMNAFIDFEPRKL